MTSRAEAFAAQAAADLETYDVLARSGLPSSQSLHALQMWLERLCKAYLWQPEAASTELRVRHNVVGKVLPQLIKQHWRRLGFEGRPDLDELQRLCREVDLLHPQVDDNGKRPENVEYPWTGASGETEVPCRWNFRLARQLHSPTGPQLLKAATLLTRRPGLLSG